MKAIIRIKPGRDLVGGMNYLTRDYPTLTIKEIENHGMSKKDLGKIILFE